MLTENWASLSPREKFEERFKSWMNPPGVEFATPEARQAYQERTQNLKDAVELKKPGRVPICPFIGFFPANYAGITAEEAMYDYEKLGMAWTKYHQDFQPDSLASSFMIGPAPIFEKLDYRMYRWPGHGTPSHTPYQFIEDEYMREDEYDLLINDPSGFWMRRYLPRVFGVLKAWEGLPPLTDIVELPFVGACVIPYGIPDIQESFKTLLEAGNMALEWIGAIGAIDGGVTATLGIPPVLAGFCKAPFDYLADTLRGTQPIMLDMYRRPEKLLKALEVMIPLNIDLGVRTATQNNAPFVFMPLHKGADGFMSDRDFARFYWPSLKAVLLGLIEEGLVPYVFVEGGYNTRLEYLADPDLPEGSIVFMFDTTDMEAVKKTLGGKQCFGGNVPGSLFRTGSPAQVEEYVKNLLEKVGQDGGFILSTGTVIDEADPEAFKAMFEAGRKYGTY